MSLYFRPSSSSAPSFFTNSQSLEGLEWVELVYQSPDGRVGLNIDAKVRSFLDMLLDKSWRFDRRLGRFIFESSQSSLNGHDLHNIASIAVVQPGSEAIAAFQELEVSRKIHERNQLLVKLGKQLVEIPEPRLKSCCNMDTRNIHSTCVRWLCTNCNYIVLLRATEHGLYAGFFSVDIMRIKHAVELTAKLAGCIIQYVKPSDPLPCW